MVPFLNKKLQYIFVPSDCKPTSTLVRLASYDFLKIQ